MALRYKFIELTIVTDESLERVVNEWVGHGWHLDGVRFVVTEHSRRPAMAFVSFTRDAPPAPPEPNAPLRLITADDNEVE